MRRETQAWYVWCFYCCLMGNIIQASNTKKCLLRRISTCFYTWVCLQTLKPPFSNDVFNLKNNKYHKPILEPRANEGKADLPYTCRHFQRGLLSRPCGPKLCEQQEKYYATLYWCSDIYSFNPALPQLLKKWKWQEQRWTFTHHLVFCCVIGHIMWPSNSYLYQQH